ncbi:MAG: purine-binding chemotaxis protein CheW [Clostridiales bacterium]|jgi:two-component system chemotaxis response regulator CheV|nr:purine-binding chemotaxis protein CheW [Clostridiales bacterium]
MDSKMLFEGETKELEILEFYAGGNSYGIDINEIKEILPYDLIATPIPNSHPYIEGMVMPRDFIIPIIDLVKSLELVDLEQSENEMLIVTSIQDLNIGFHVDSVNGIHRLSTDEVKKPGKNISTKVKEAVIGKFERNNITIEILDLRYIITMINADVLK